LPENTWSQFSSAGATATEPATTGPTSEGAGAVETHNSAGDEALTGGGGAGDGKKPKED